MEKYLEIKSLLINDSITYGEAFVRIKNLSKPWHTKHWEQMRQKHLKDKCENCGTSESPLVIQHTKQPTEFNVLRNKIRDKYIDYEKIKEEVIKNDITEWVVKDYLEQNSTIRGTCPECGTIIIRKNNKKNIFICSKKHVFDTPIDILYYTASRTQDLVKATESAIKCISSMIISEKMRKLNSKYDLQIGKEALLLSIEEGIEYRLFKNIKTCCKRCAAVEDKIIPKYTLCKVCKIKYHAPIYETCYNCREKIDLNYFNKHHTAS